MGNLTSSCADDVALETVEVYERVGGDWEPIGTADGTWAGTHTSPRLPSGVAFLLKLWKSRSGYADKKYIAGLVHDAQNNDAWVASVLTAGANAIEDIVAEFTATNSVEIVGVYFNRVSEEIAQYTGGTAVALPSYQRRRRPGTGLT